MPLAEPGDRNPLLGLEHFVYDAEKDHYTCPQGETLSYYYTRHALNLRAYRAEAATCNSCALKSQCTTGSKGRLIHRNFREQYSERVRAYHQTAAYERAMGKRKIWVEPLFAEAKQWHGMRRFRLRRLWRVNCEAFLIASGQNLKRLLQKRGWRRRPFPTQAVALRLPEPPEAERLPESRVTTHEKRGVAAAFLASWPTRKALAKVLSRLFCSNIYIDCFILKYYCSCYFIFYLIHAIAIVFHSEEKESSYC